VAIIPGALATIWSTDGPLASCDPFASAVPVHRLPPQRSCSPGPRDGRFRFLKMIMSALWGVMGSRMLLAAKVKAASEPPGQ
jgi:hypothetical protein